MSFVSSAIHNPVTFSHEVPGALGQLPALPTSGPGYHANGLSIPGFGGIPTEFRSAKNYGSGVQSSNDSIKCYLYQSLRERKAHQTCEGSLVFIDTRSTDSNPVHTTEYTMYSISVLNRRLRDEMDLRVLYGSRTNSRKLQADYTFFGAQIGETVGEYSSQADGLTSVMQCFNVAKRTRMPSIFAALKSNTVVGGHMKQWARMFLVYRRYEYEQPLQTQFGDNAHLSRPSKRARQEDDSHYWQIEPYVSSDGRPPVHESWSFDGGIDADQPDMPYKTEPWVGDYLYLGKAWGFYGEQRVTNEIRSVARRALHPLSTDPPEQYKRDMAPLPHVEFYMRVW